MRLFYLDEPRDCDECTGTQGTGEYLVGDKLLCERHYLDQIHGGFSD